MREEDYVCFLRRHHGLSESGLVALELGVIGATRWDRPYIPHQAQRQTRQRARHHGRNLQMAVAAYQSHSRMKKLNGWAWRASAIASGGATIEIGRALSSAHHTMGVCVCGCFMELTCTFVPMYFTLSPDKPRRQRSSQGHCNISRFHPNMLPEEASPR